MYPPHLTTGSQQPPLVDGKLRLYSMEFCPYAQRARLVLSAKNIPHDIVNINLINKPDWYFKVHPEGKVPALDTGKEIVVESLDLADFLDDKYPETPLYPSDPDAKQKDKDLIQKIGPLTGVFSKCVFGLETKTGEEWVKDFEAHLQIFEDELVKRGTTFFGGNETPGMVDYMLWPWGERAGVIAIVTGQKLPFSADRFPAMQKWKKAMKEFSVCREMYHGPEKFHKVVEFKLKNLEPDYDGL